ncbi:MAG: glutamate--tRNA ligase family protein [Hyphomicrobiaceae bacterium]
MTATSPVVRFAPSPTGYLHIGGARTALFNWLYAKGRDGKFLLRIEDTDRERNNPQAVAAIIDGLTWLELDWNGEPVSQFARATRHREVAESMLAAGTAYKCFMTADELTAIRERIEAERETAKNWLKALKSLDRDLTHDEKADLEAATEAATRPLTVFSPWRDRSPDDAPNGAPFAIRLKAPRDGETVIDDAVQGRVVFPNKDLDDLIILRSDGNPTYNLAVVVDDHDMGITHVVRGVDHLTNAARQVQIYAANAWTIPQFAHVPLIHGADGAKLSKRHGALGIEAYRSMGYLPAALRNYLVRLGWSHGDDEIIGTPQLIEWFDLPAIGRSAARMDLKKLEDTNAHYIRSADNAELLKRSRELLELYSGGFADLASEHDAKVMRGDVVLARNVLALLPGVPDGKALAARFNAAGWDQFAAAIPGLKERAKTLPELIDGALFLVTARPLKIDDKAAKLLDSEAKAIISALIPKLAANADWTAADLEAVVRQHAEDTGAKLGKVAQPLRAALTGRSVSPPVFDVMSVLGRTEALARLGDQAA